MVRTRLGRNNDIDVQYLTQLLSSTQLTELPMRTAVRPIYSKSLRKLYNIPESSQIYENQLGVSGRD